MFKFFSGCLIKLFILLFVCVLACGGLYWGYQKLDPSNQAVVREKSEQIMDFLEDQDGVPEEVLDFIHSVWDKFTDTSAAQAQAPLPFEGQTQYAFAGLPEDVSYPGNLRLLKRRGYYVGYDESRRNPAWVAYSVTTHHSESGKRPSRFTTDTDTKTRVTHDDYTGSGYDRGHMAPNYGIGVTYGYEAQKETFLMSNIIPQTPALNRGIWKDLEQTVANDYAPEDAQIWVITGPVYYSEKPQALPSGVAIPDACFKILADQTDDGAIRTLSFIIPQDVPDNARAEDYLVTIDAVESATGLDFFEDLPDNVEDPLEKVKSKRVW